MNFELFVLGGYNLFVWPAFAFTFISCLILYVKTKKELKEQEKMFLKEFNHINTVKDKTPEGKEITKEALLGNPF